MKISSLKKLSEKLKELEDIDYLIFLLKSKFILKFRDEFFITIESSCISNKYNDRIIDTLKNIREELKKEIESFDQ